MSDKTNAVRILDRGKIDYKRYSYPAGEVPPSGEEVAALIGQDVSKVFKTLVTVGKSHKNYVFMVPVAKELDLKKAAVAAGEKSIEMLKSKELLPLTGYVHGGCSPIGMKKQFATTADESALLFDEIMFSAGRVGSQVKMKVDDLQKAVPIAFADLTK